MLENVYGNEVLSCIHVSELFETFKQGCEHPENDPDTGRLPTDAHIVFNYAREKH